MSGNFGEDTFADGEVYGEIFDAEEDIVWGVHDAGTVLAGLDFSGSAMVFSS